MTLDEVKARLAELETESKQLREMAKWLRDTIPSNSYKNHAWLHNANYNQTFKTALSYIIRFCICEDEPIDIRKMDDAEYSKYESCFEDIVSSLDKYIPEKYWEIPEESTNPTMTVSLMKSTRLRDTNISVRLYNTLVRSGKVSSYSTIGDLLNFSPEDVRSFRHMGNKCWKEFLQMVHEVDPDWGV